MKKGLLPDSNAKLVKNRKIRKCNDKVNSIMTHICLRYGSGLSEKASVNRMNY